MRDSTKQCTKCGQYLPLSEFYGNSRGGLLPRCKTCIRDYQREASREYRKSHKENSEKHSARSRRYYKSHREEVLIKTRVKRGSSKVGEFRTRKQYPPSSSAEELKERKRERDRLYRNANKEKRIKANLQWAKANPDKIKIYRRKYDSLRRAQKRNSQGSYTTNDIKTLLKQQKDCCWWCGKKLNGDFHVDHRIPLSRGGSNDANNIVISCPPCNRSKHNKLPHEWDGSGGRLL